MDSNLHIPEARIKYEIQEREKCRAKKSFDTELAAVKFAATIRVVQKKKFRVYHCPWCSQYHLTRRMKL